jgi:hypothetical protein
MRFALSEEQRHFAASLRDLLGDAGLPAISQAWAVGDAGPGLGLVGRLGELGVTGLAVPAAHGGVGASAVDLVVAFVELGRFAVPGPLVESIAVVPTVLSELGTAEWLPELADGRCLATAHWPPSVPYAVDADVASLVLGIGERQVTIDAPSGPALRSVDPARRLFGVRPGRVLAGEVPAVAFEIGALATAAQLLGAGRALLETSCEYARQRSQFGRPIGQFQAVKHQLANVLVGLELAEPLLFGAALSRSARDVSAAKVACADAAYRAARTALQVHGAVGYTLEHELGRWITKVRALVSAWGTQALHRERVATALAEEVAACA